MDLSCSSLAALTKDIRACRLCRDAPRYGAPLPHEPRPVFQVSASARLCIAGQAPGVRVHASGRPYTDPSGVRLRSWLGIGEEIFYDPEIVAVVAMGFCFPGLDGKGGDLPPRRECAELWREPIVWAFAQFGAHSARRTICSKVASWREDRRRGIERNGRRLARSVSARQDRPRLMPMPHPSWRNNGWLKRNPWFETDLLPVVCGPRCSGSSGPRL